MPSATDDIRVQLIKPAYVTYYHEELSKIKPFFLNFGLHIVEERDDAIFYAGYGVEPYCYVARKSPTGKASFGGGAFVVSSRVELEKASKIPGAGKIVAIDAPGGGEMVTAVDPAGFPFHLIYGQEEKAKMDMPAELKRMVYNYEDEKPRKGRSNASSLDQLRLLNGGHFGLVFPQGMYEELSEFYMKYLSLVPTDIVLIGEEQKPGVVFFHIDLGLDFTDHHAFFLKEADPGEAITVAHSAFEVHDFDVQQLGHDFLVSKGYNLCWGVGRHFLGSQIFDYWFDPSGFIVEHYADGDMVNSKTPIARVPAGPGTLAVWGPDVPREFGVTELSYVEYVQYIREIAIIVCAECGYGSMTVAVSLQQGIPFFVSIAIGGHSKRLASKIMGRGYGGELYSPLADFRGEGPFVPFLPIIPNAGLDPHSRILRKGSKRHEYNMPLPCDILLEKDFAFPMRDGIKIYGDIYRPVPKVDGAAVEKVPVVMTFAPYGKEGNSEGFHDKLPERLGIKKEMYSGYEPFEGPDPAYWCARGYAVVEVDSRGSWNSEGNMYFWGRQDELDGYDTIEYLADLPWCNGKIGMCGNSWLAIVQWFIASTRPPHLAAIAPWEGQTDAYRDNGRRGGMPEPTMSHAVGLMTPGRGMQEDQGKEIDTRELWDEYWEDKRAKVGKVQCPVYALASYSSKLHGQGTIRGWREVKSQEKWLRIHPHFEWYDWWHNQDDLCLFFDHYLKGIANSWTSTPPVRLSMLGFSSVPDIVNRPLSTYPPPSMALKTYYVDANSNTSSTKKVAKESSATYRATEFLSEATFDIIFDKYTEIAGFAKLSLWLQCHDHDDMDVYVLLGKIDKHGNPLTSVNFVHTTPVKDLPKTNVVQYQGPTGFLRASHREWKARGPSYADEISAGDLGEGDKWTGEQEMWHPHVHSQKVPKGDIVNVQFTTWPMGVVYEKGEGMRIRVGGRDICFVEALELPVNATQNIGSHVVHTGGRYDSHIILPILGK